VAQLFNGGGKLLQGLASVLGSCPQSVPQRPGWSPLCRQSVGQVESPGLQGSKQIRGPFSRCPSAEHSPGCRCLLYGVGPSTTYSCGLYLGAGAPRPHLEGRFYCL
jgi:hypothetical protein